MLKLFKQNMALQVLLILVALVILWCRQLIEPPALPTSAADGVLYTLIVKALGGVPRLCVVLAMLLVVAEGVILNLTMANVNLVPQTTLMPTFLYVLCASATTSTLTPAILVCAVLLLFINRLIIRGTLITISIDRICSATALISICSLLYLPAAFFLLSYLLVAAGYRLYNWREVATMILGLAAPYSLLVFVLYMFGGLTPWWDTTTAAINSIQVTMSSIGTVPMVANIVLATIFAVSLFIFGNKLSERTVTWKANAHVVLYLTVGGLAMSLCGQVLPLDMSVFAAPFALCGTHLLMADTTMHHTYARGKRRQWIYDILLVLIIVAAILC